PRTSREVPRSGRSGRPDRPGRRPRGEEPRPPGTRPTSRRLERERAALSGGPSRGRDRPGLLLLAADDGRLRLGGGGAAGLEGQLLLSVRLADLDRDRVLAGELAAQERLGHGVLQVLLDRPPQRP